ncbi:MAG: FprA family A-type flavoprotein [Candidatus Hadarchaeales archaeon]
MSAFKVCDGIYSVGVPDHDRRLFDELIPLPDGTSYNSYLVKGNEKTALIDTVYLPRMNQLLLNLKKVGVNRLDYIISNHSEGDHSGSIPKLLELHPECMIVTNKKCKEMLIDSLHVPDEKFIVIEDGQELDLGGKTLEFMITPWVHWPDTMVTYLREDRILFTCDLFGSHLSPYNPLEPMPDKIEAAAKRYYAEIMMPFRAIIRKHMERIRRLDIRMVAPSHGPVHMPPDQIFSLYDDWISDRVKNEAVIPYVSMYGDTLAMVDRLSEALTERGISVRPFNITKTDIGELAMALVDAATVVIGAPTVLAGPHPSALYVATIMNALRPKTRFLSFFGSYGWGGRAVEIIKAATSGMGAEFLEPVLVKGYPTEDDRSIEDLAGRIAAKHRDIGILKP